MQVVLGVVRRRISFQAFYAWEVRVRGCLGQLRPFDLLIARGWRRRAEATAIGMAASAEDGVGVKRMWWCSLRILLLVLLRHGKVHEVLLGRFSRAHGAGTGIERRWVAQWARRAVRWAVKGS